MKNRPRGKKAPVVKLPPSRAIRFPEVKGKTLEWVELWLDDDEESYLEFRFQNQTALVFVVQPYAGFTLSADYGDWKTKNWRRIKQWPPFRAG